MKKRFEAVTTMQSWLGITQGSEGHKKILSLYNEHLPHPRGHKAVVTDYWCAETVCACMVKIGMDDITPFECSCKKIIEQAQSMGIWEENDGALDIRPGDWIIFDWEDDGKGDCTGEPNHIGIVETYDVNLNIVTTIEGNYSGKVGRRKMRFDDIYVRGFVKPDYESKDQVIATDIKEYFYTVQKGDNLTKIAANNNCSKSDLIEWNKEKYPKIAFPPHWVYVGWELLIKKV